MLDNYLGSQPLPHLLNFIENTTTLQNHLRKKKAGSLYLCGIISLSFIMAAIFFNREGTMVMLDAFLLLVVGSGFWAYYTFSRRMQSLIDQAIEYDHKILVRMLVASIAKKEKWSNLISREDELTDDDYFDLVRFLERVLVINKTAGNLLLEETHIQKILLYAAKQMGKGRKVIEITFFDNNLNLLRKIPVEIKVKLKQIYDELDAIHRGGPMMDFGSREFTKNYIRTYYG